MPAKNLNTINADMDGARALANIHAFRNHVDRITTGYRPNISENGPRKRGPMLKPEM